MPWFLDWVRVKGGMSRVAASLPWTRSSTLTLYVAGLGAGEADAPASCAVDGRGVRPGSVVLGVEAGDAHGFAGGEGEDGIEGEFGGAMGVEGFESIAVEGDFEFAEIVGGEAGGRR